MDENNHNVHHLYAMALLRSHGCLEIKGKCCAALGRHRLAHEAFDASLQDPTYTLTAATRCRSGTMAMKGNLPEQATRNFRQALTLNPMLWEAFEGLSSFVKQGPPEEPPPAKALSGPTVTGVGFFMPDITVNTTLFHGRKNIPQAFRMDPPPDSHDSM
ncbi:hypothetical protein BDR07DRAFT_1359826 [Suillus spraguei]|nr:hypothetical protein BDR07DRAFT_1359826 [Suillus spraguei]